MLRPNAGCGLIFEVCRSHTTTHHSRYNSCRLVISSSERTLTDNTQHSQETGIHAPDGIRTHNLSRRAAADLRAATGTIIIIIVVCTWDVDVFCGYFVPDVSPKNELLVISYLFALLSMWLINYLSFLNNHLVGWLFCLARREKVCSLKILALQF